MSNLGTVWDKLCTMERTEIFPLLLDAEQLDKTGILPLDAPLRLFTEQFYYGESNSLQMTFIAYNVYKIVAMTYYNSLTTEEMHEHVHRVPFLPNRGEF
jgi:hypothetical protein